MAAANEIITNINTIPTPPAERREQDVDDLIFAFFPQGEVSDR